MQRALDRGETCPPLGDFARAAGISASTLYRAFMRELGLSPRVYFQGLRQRRLRTALKPPVTVTEAMYASGYGSPASFYASDAHGLSMQPSRFVAGGEGEQIRFAVGASSLGSVCIAATERGVCAIELGDEPQTVLDAMQTQFCNAELIGADATFELLVARVLAVLDGTADARALPLDVRGTVFQKKVWLALRDVPAGQVVTYEHIAMRIGVPKGARAVAAACAANRLAVAIPCHRVVRKDGSLSGYRWGVERKQALLRRETSST